MASNKMLIDATHPEETRVVVLRDGRVEEFDYESAARKLLRGNIYLAKVTRVEPALQAAFVDYGGNRHGFLAFNEIHPDYYQIPIADRQALIDEEAAAEARAEAEVEARVEAAAKRAAARSARRGPKDDDQDGEAADATEDDYGDDDLDDGVGDDRDDGVEDDRDDGVGDDRDDGVGDDRDDGVEDGLDADADGDDQPTARGERAARRAADPTRADDDFAEDIAEDGEIDIAAGETGSPDGAPEAYANSDDDAAGEDEPAEASTDAEGDPVDEIGSQDALEELPVRPRRTRRSYKIQEVIKRRQVLLVQVVKEERGNKGAALTTYLSLAGRYTVLMPNTARGGGISRKITSPQDRKRLKAIANDLEVPEGMGLIIRTAGAARTKQEIRRDFEYLLRLWESVRELTLESTAPNLVYEEGNLIKRSIRDLYNKDVDEVHVAGTVAYREAKDFMRMLMPSHAKNVINFQDPQPLFAKHKIEHQLNAMFSPFVTLKSGGYLVINQTEALVAVDVNSGKSTREFSIEETALNTNLEAAEEMARQLKLRDLAGLIVIDFIDMEERRNNRAVERRIKDALKGDRARIQVGRISHFGLLEMSRQRLRTGVLEGSTSQCDHCQGTGIIRSTESVALAVLRGLEDSVMAGANTALIANTTPEVALYILNHKREFIVDMEARHGLPIQVQGSDKLVGANFTIEKGTAPAIARRRPFKPVAVNMESGFDSAEDIARDEQAALEEVAETDARVDSERDQDSSEDGERPRSRRRRGRRSRSRNSHDDTRAANANDPIDDDTDANDADLDGDDEGDAGNSASEALSSQDGDSAGDSKPRRRRRGRRGGRRARERNEERGSENGSEHGQANNGDGQVQAHASGTDRTGDDTLRDAPTSDARASKTNGTGDQPSWSGEEREPSDAPKRRSRSRRSAAKPVDDTHAGTSPPTVATDTVQDEQPTASQPQPKPQPDRTPEPELVPAGAAAEAPSAAPIAARRGGRAAASAPSEPVIERVKVTADGDAAAANVSTPDADQPARKGWWQRRILGND